MPENQFNPATLYWNACTKLAIMYMSVSTVFTYQILELVHNVVFFVFHFITIFQKKSRSFDIDISPVAESTTQSQSYRPFMGGAAQMIGNGLKTVQDYIKDKTSYFTGRGKEYDVVDVDEDLISYQRGLPGMMGCLMSCILKLRLCENEFYRASCFVVKMNGYNKRGPF